MKALCIDNKCLSIAGHYLSNELPIFTLSLQTDGNGTISANSLSGHPGDTVTLSRKPNERYNNSTYSVSGGTINDNTFTFGYGNATVKANFSAAAYSGYRLMITGFASTASFPTEYMQIQEYGIGYDGGGPYYGPNYWTVVSTALSGNLWTSTRPPEKVFDGDTTTEAGKFDASNFTACRIDFRTENSNKVIPQNVAVVTVGYQTNYSGSRPATVLYGYNDDRGEYDTIKDIPASALPVQNYYTYTATC